MRVKRVIITLIRLEYLLNCKYPSWFKLKQFAFLDKCGEKGSTTNIQPMSQCSGGVCIEMLIVSNGIYSIVRGCLNDFFPPDHPVPTGNLECIYGASSQNATVVSANKVEFVRQATVGLSLCQASSGEPCNTKLAINDKFAKGQQAQTDGWGPECKKASGMVECLKCMRNDMEGDCHRDVRTYCTGRWLEVRGCAPFNPLNTQSCTTSERNSELSQLGDTQISQHLSVEQCFCSGQRCNSATSIKPNKGVLKHIITGIVALILVYIS
uniref:Protein quiver n=1 Tax=Meloidogyne hapla TaxID=6305 RepID=A0A1I8BND2_MELHA